MTPPTTSRVLETLTDGEPTYDELVDLYNDLRRAPAETDPQTVSQRALAQVVGEFVDYLDFVSVDLEKSVGISRAQERRRVLDSLVEPTGDDPLERVADLVRQWDDVEQYTRDDVVEIVERSVSEADTGSKAQARSRTDS